MIDVLSRVHGEGMRFAVAQPLTYRGNLVHLGESSDDEVIMSPAAPVAAAELVRAAGAVPRLVDVTERGLHLSPELLVSAINEQTRAVLISHVAGCRARWMTC